jgi:hypothetical protein
LLESTEIAIQGETARTRNILAYFGPLARVGENDPFQERSLSRFACGRADRSRIDRAVQKTASAAHRKVVPLFHSSGRHIICRLLIGAARGECDVRFVHCEETSHDAIHGSISIWKNRLHLALAIGRSNPHFAPDFFVARLHVILRQLASATAVGARHEIITDCPVGDTPRRPAPGMALFGAVGIRLLAERFDRSGAAHRADHGGSQRSSGATLIHSIMLPPA